MTIDQASLFAIFGFVFALLIWGRIRYDLVAFTALIVATAAELVPTDQMFAGFGHPAVVIIALVLIVSRGLMNSGAIELVASRLIATGNGVSRHIGVMSIVAAALSAVINNVAALALLMPLDIEAARKAKRAVALTLMPLSFATILGGMITLIGTPPNIVIAQYRQDALGAPFSMFDFAPVGATVSIFGVLFVALVGWRLLPARVRTAPADTEAAETLYVAELRVGQGSKSEGFTLGDLYPLADEKDINVLGLVRNGRRLPGFARREPVREGDFVIVEGNPKSIESFMGAGDLEFEGSEKHEAGVTGGSLTLMEAIVPETSRMAGRTATGMRLLYRHGVTLLGVSRQGRRFHDRVRRLTLHPGDVLLLLGTPENLETATSWLGVLPLEGRRTGVVQRNKAGLAVGAFLFAIAVTVAGITSLPVALAACAVFYAATGLVDGTEVYEAVEWQVVVLLASLIPLGIAFETSGGAELIASGIVALTWGAPAWVVLLALMVVTMTLSDFLNNVATALIAAPIGIQVARTLDVNPDAFLMGVAVAASCAFLTPIGHKNNTIIMGPGGYRFGDYWRMGLALELIVLAVAVPSILVFWPL
ncbi:SLC13 family permease [Polymorphum gilvum]|uniref:Citrate transporter superfamily n=1 Tax=Polymorphum gilvum (strain LMG 25793 / CGMCC 1.9160 / SL003B-26A1) TaxID=991905 RepID=F2IZQ7_POLGS|nr:SLC13 family permease [Polymorphum gilvum]ADZ69614.1 Citrate transporter superfamily [Polymorphum gilvum SL003B-26A1]